MQGIVQIKTSIERAWSLLDGDARSWGSTGETKNGIDEKADELVNDE